MRRNRIVLFGLFILMALVGVYFTIDLFGQQALNRLYTPIKLVNIEKGYKEGIQKRINIPQSNDPKLRIAMAPIMSPERTLPLYKDLINYLGERLGMEPVLLQRSSYAEVNDLLEYDNCDVGFICTYPFVLGERSYGLKLLAVPRMKGKITCQSFIIVPAVSDKGSLLELRGKRFASCDIISQSGWIYPALWLKQRGEDPRKFFSEHIITGSHDRAVQAVASKFVDGAAVQSLVYERMVQEDPTLADKVRIIMKSPEFGNPPLVANPRLDPALRERLRRILLLMHESPEGRKILADLGIDRYEFPDKTLYDDVRKYAVLWNPE